ncbi:MAG: hypothetical protein OXD54_15675 [Candidatus Poribacteria bacterium]|nr:hypothetical protein [Candidatus Poribacteria bacterium]
MKHYIFIPILISFTLLTGLAHTNAQTQDGYIPFDCPDVPPPMFKFDLNRELIKHISTDETFSGIENLFIHTYDKEDGLYEKLVEYYSKIIKQKGWISYVEDDNKYIYILTNSNPESDSAEGIFVIVNSRFVIHQLNVIGNISQHQIGKLLANINLLGIWMPELNSLGEPIDQSTIQSEPTFEEKEITLIDKKSPTILRILEDTPKSTSRISETIVETLNVDWTYNALPIKVIEINSHTTSRKSSHKERLDDIRDILYENIQHPEDPEDPEDFNVILDKLLDSYVSAYIEKVTVNTDEQLIKMTLKEIPEKVEGQFILSKQYQTSDSDPIDVIQVNGLQQIEPDIIKSTLEDGPMNIENATEHISDTIPEFDIVEFEIEKFGQQRIAKITVQENPIQITSYTSVMPRIGLNRVTGWELGARVETGLRPNRKTDYSPLAYGWTAEVPNTEYNSKLYAQFGYGFGNDQPYYQFGGNYIWNETEHWKVGITAQFQNAITTLNTDFHTGYDDGRSTFFRMYGVPEHQDYYLRKGSEVAIHWITKWSSSMKLSFLWETHESLDKSTDWHFFNMRSHNKLRDNLTITPSKLRSISLKTDITNRKKHLGWHNTFIIEHSNPSFGSDFNWTRTQSHFRYAFPFARNQFRSRFVISTALGEYTDNQEGPTLLPIQRQFILGGIGTLNGYPQNTFLGDEGYLMNVELLLGLPKIIDFNILNNIHAVLFFDMGQAWTEYRSGWNFEPKTSAGIGLQVSSDIDILRFNIAKALYSKQEIQYNLMIYYSF